MCDSLGATQSLGFIGRNVHCFAPKGDGLIYFHDRDLGGRIQYLDSSNQEHDLLDVNGTAPFELVASPWNKFAALMYHPKSHSLIAASSSNTSAACFGRGTNMDVAIRRIPLSADGSRLTGPVMCTEFHVSTTSEEIEGVDILPTGWVLITVDTNSTASEQRLICVDPFTMSTWPFATTGGYAGSGAISGGCFVGAFMNKAVVVDSLDNKLRTFSYGSNGPGTALPIQPVSAGGTNEVATLVTIRGTRGCNGSFQAYGQGLAGDGGFVPALSGTGCPIPGATPSLHISQGLGSSNGFLAIGPAPAAVPFVGGTLLVDATSSINITLGGPIGGTGIGHLTVPYAIPGNPAMTGQSVFFQAFLLDPSATQGLSQTPGLEMIIG